MITQSLCVFIHNFETLKYFCQTKDKCLIGHKNAFFVQSLLGKILDLIMSITHCVFWFSADFQHYQRIWVQAPLCRSDWKWTLNGRHSAWIGHQLRLRKPEDYPWGFPIELISPRCYHGLHIVPMYQSSLIVALLSLLPHVCTHMHIRREVRTRCNSFFLNIMISQWYTCNIHVSQKVQRLCSPEMVMFINAYTYWYRSRGSHVYIS